MRATLTALAVLMAFPAYAQECIKFDDLDAKLRGQFQERAIILAMNDAGIAYLFYGNPDTETWTFVILNGPCAVIVGEGVGYEEIPAFAGDPA
jgi:hypothetical protein